MFQAARPLDGFFTAFRASLVTLHAELILPLPGDLQIREFVFYPFSHSLNAFLAVYSSLFYDRLSL
jgi:hypothetical protein